MNTMSATQFTVTEHVISTQHVREYPRGARSDEAALSLSLVVKEYRPRNNNPAAPGSVTLIAAHANGCPKETYEAFWDELTTAYEGRIRAIWMADVANQGASGVLNERLLGDDPSWLDTARDMLHMVNVFRKQMPRPIVGIGHSMGATHLVLLSLMHPRLFVGLTLIEPIITAHPPAGPNNALSSSFRADLWPSRAEGAARLAKNRFFKAWDRRALDKYVQHGLRDVPTAVYPNASAGQKPSPSPPRRLRRPGCSCAATSNPGRRPTTKRTSADWSLMPIPRTGSKCSVGQRC